MTFYARICEVLGLVLPADESKESAQQNSEDDVFLIRHRHPDGTVSYEATEELMKAAALAASKVPPPDLSEPTHR